MNKKNNNFKVISSEAVGNFIKAAAMLSGANDEASTQVVFAFEMLVNTIKPEDSEACLEMVKEGIIKLDPQEEC